jgi:hypothetical protein
LSNKKRKLIYLARLLKNNTFFSKGIIEKDLKNFALSG